MAPSTHGRPRAFTLAEMLAVIAIIALLLALLMPALARARAHARRTHCAANLRSIGQALTMYVQGYGCYPTMSLSINPGGGAFGLWPVRLRPFSGGSYEVFSCPSQDPRCRWPDGGLQRATALHARFGYDLGEPLLDLYTVHFSYGYNMWGIGGRDNNPPSERHHGLGQSVYAFTVLPQYVQPQELRASRVRNPSEMIAITDATADGTWDFAVYAGHGYERMWPGKMHEGGANVLFCDGHVTWYLQKDLTRVQGDPHPSEAVLRTRKMWNNDNQHHW